MKNTKLIFSLVLLFFSFIFNACKKDPIENKTSSTTQTNSPSYSQLKVGNYWIYQRFEIDSLGNETALNKFDSCFIENDTVINNKIYYKMYRPKVYGSSTPTYLVDFIRDSLHYIVNSTGYTLFSSQDFTSIFRSGYQFFSNPTDTVQYFYIKMDDINVQVNTPAGNFNTLNSKTTLNFWPNYSLSGTVRYMHCRYANSVGIVIETLPLFISDKIQTERRLIRYHLN
jgi:hypothetical protein